MLKKFIILFVLPIIFIPKISYSSTSHTNIQENYRPFVEFFEKHLSEEELSNFKNLLAEFDGFHGKDFQNCKPLEECGEAALKTFTEINDFIKTKSGDIFINNAVSDESINFIKEITEKNDTQLKRWNEQGGEWYFYAVITSNDDDDEDSSMFDISSTQKTGIENIKTIDSNDNEASQTNSDTSDQLTDALKSSLVDVIDENLSKDLQFKIAKYVNAISKNITEKEKTKLLDSTTKMLSITSKRDKNDINQLFDLLDNLKIIINIINPYILDEMDKQNIPNNLQIGAWIAFSDLLDGINNLDESKIKSSLKVISEALVADSITEDNKEVAKKETETETTQNNESKKVVYNTDENKEEIGKAQKSGKKGFRQDGIKVKKRNIISTNTLLECMPSSTGCQFVLDDKTVFYLESGTEIIINSYYIDEDGTQIIKACLLDGGFYFKTLRKIKSQLTINIKNKDINFYDAIISKGPNAKIGVSKEDNVLDVVNAGGTNVSQLRIYPENADTKLDNINISNIEDVANMFNAPVSDILPSITNANGDPCINPNFGDISIKVQEIITNTCSHSHAHVDGEDGEPLIEMVMLGSKNDAGHQDEFDEGYYDLGENCNPDIVIPYIICPDDFSCTLPGTDPKKDPNVNPDPNVDPGDDHHSG